MKKNRKKVSKADSHLGCGETLGIDKIKQDDTVLIIGSGVGSDCFLASKKVGDSGKVIGVDMNRNKVSKAKKEALKQNYKNIKFKLGQIENLPVEDNSIDVVISHCVINLISDKLRAYREIYRVLKKGGKMYISDMVLRRNLSEIQKNSLRIPSDCMEGALLKSKYLKILRRVGFGLNPLLRGGGAEKRKHEKLPLERLSIVVRK